MAKTKKRKTKKKTVIALIVVFSLILLLALAYLGGILFFRNKFLPNTSVNDVEVSFKNSEEANELLLDQTPYMTVIQADADGGDPVIEELDLTILDDAISYDSSVLLDQQDILTWFTSFFSQRNYRCNKISGLSKLPDIDQINELIADLYCLQEENIVMPENASLEFEDGQIIETEESDGCYISRDKVVELISNAVSRLYNGLGMDTVDLRNSYEKPTLKRDDPAMASLKETAKNVLNKTIHFNIDEDEEYDLEADEFACMLTIRDKKLAVDEDELGQFISDFCMDYDYYDEASIDKASLKSALEEALLSTGNETINVNWTYETIKQLIEVDISEQMLYYYENDVLILSSPVVTGNGDITDATPQGHFEITRMKEDSTLSGANYSEHVDYWIGFDETGRIYGIHDASWRDEFGGDIWLHDPSRGCVNMPTDKISQLWNYVDLGVEVYVHE